jgi:hypothetical protein
MNLAYEGKILREPAMIGRHQFCLVELLFHRQLTR